MTHTMDVCNIFTLAMLILQNICDISARNDHQRTRKRQPIQEVTKWSCGKSYEVRKELFLLYDGAFLGNPCIITIINADRSSYSRTCVKLDEIFPLDSSFGCENSFRFYFGNNATKNVTNFLSCSDILQEVCDVHKTAYASFSSYETFDKKFQIKVSAMKEYSKRTADTGHSDVDTSISKLLMSGASREESWDSWTPLMTTRKSWSYRGSWTTRRPSWSSWTTWTESWPSWSSWYSEYEKEKEEKKKNKTRAGVIIIAVLGSVFGVAFSVLGCMFLRLCCSQTDRTGQTNQNYTEVLGNQAVTSASQDAAVTSRENIGDDSSASAQRFSAVDLDHSPTNLTQDNVTENHHIPSAPPEESTDNGLGTPPPSYSSLFPSK